ncbi:MAG: sigma-70 family RNA polymerase sigma factor, partial [Clostridia bacterium]|nr:sigma-70 family RNA polymerase sigma factor [Clostridia bacterium]
VNEYYKQNGAKPTVKQLSNILGENEETIIEAMECRTPLSLDSTVKGEDSDVPLYEVIADERNSFESFEDGEALKSEIEKLSPTEKEVVSLRFLKGKSQAETGKIMGVSQMFVSRAERKIVEKLREALSQ